jgi:KaiC/GvpD/RAD55 family RecA-like ATPase
MKLLKTCIAGFDEFLQGGLPPRIILLTGLPGTGNEVFARQTAYNRAKQTGISYFTVNVTPEVVREDMAAFGWDITPLEDSGSWKFKTIPKTGSLTAAVTSEMEQRRSVVIDSLSEILLARKTQETINLLSTMSLQNRELNEFHLLLLTKEMQNRQAEIAMQHFAEGVIVFTMRWSADSAVRHVVIKKMRGTPAPTRRLPYSIGKRGFLIETATRIT